MAEPFLFTPFLSFQVAYVKEGRWTGIKKENEKFLIKLS
jgi:hypothetical protein